MNASTLFGGGECPQHHGQKRDPEVTPETCDAIGEKSQVILVVAPKNGQIEVNGCSCGDNLLSPPTLYNRSPGGHLVSHLHTTATSLREPFFRSTSIVAIS